jgi:hypothetical protein
MSPWSEASRTVLQMNATPSPPCGDALLSMLAQRIGAVFSLAASVTLFGQSLPLGSSGFALPPINISSASSAWDLTMKSRPSVAFNGEIYLVAWRDERDPASGNVYAARVTPSGEVLDLTGIPVPGGSNNQQDPLPRVAACGRLFLVTWEYQGNSPDEHVVYGCRIGEDGNVLDAAGFRIASGPGARAYPNLAANNINWLVVWRDAKTGATGDIYGTFIRTNGEVVSPGGFAVSSHAQSQSVPSIASNGVDFFVAWHDYRNGATEDWDIYGTKISADGSVASPSGVAIARAAHQQWFANVASNGSEFLVTWSDGRNESTFGTNGDIYGSRVSSSGTLLTPNSLLISLSQGNQEDPFAASDGSDYFVIWDDDRDAATGSDIYGVRLSPNGQVEDISGWPVNQNHSVQAKPAIASGKDHQFLVVHSAANSSDSTYKIFGNLIYSREPDLKITEIRSQQGLLTLKWKSVTSFTYELQSVSQLGEPWEPVPGRIVATSVVSSKTSDATNVSQRYYRIAKVT